jgi:hypothetical protein
VTLVRMLSGVGVAAASISTLVYGCAAAPGGLGLEDKTLWDYLDLLFVPAALALGAYWLNRTQRMRELRHAEAQEKRALIIERQRAQDEALQAYLDQMSQLLTDKDRPLHRAEPHDRLSRVARARTLTVLTRLDGDRKGSALNFLSESGLITGSRPILDLSGADLSKTILEAPDLRGARFAGADFGQATLPGADFRGANLYFAALKRANLRGAKLGDANLLSAVLSHTILSRADLKEANLRLAVLTDADLSYADLEGADLGGTSCGELEQEAASLKGATMPNGQKYEDWLKSKGRGEDGENSGP